MPSNDSRSPLPFHWGDRTFVMGALNATPDSFSGDGLADDPSALLARARAMVDAGADMLDIGGESTRPGFRDVPAEEEMRRVLPVVERVARSLAIPVSIDTRKAEVAHAALGAGASIVNDVSGLADPEMVSVVSEAGAGLVIVHGARAEPGEDVVRGILRGVDRLVEDAVRAGVAPENIIVDPGLGFGKGWRENFVVFRRLPELRRLGLPILVGPSRKGMIGKVLSVDIHDRLEGTITLVSIAIAHGADAVRVHDVRENVRAVRMMDALVR